MSDESEIEWPDELQCIECGAVVGDDGAKIQYESLVTPVKPEIYAWCNEHAPETVKEEDELWQSVKKGELIGQSQSWEDY